MLNNISESEISLKNKLLKIANDTCPECGSKTDFKLVTKTTRFGKSIGAYCRKCGYMMDLVGKPEEIMSDTSLYDVIINGKSTNLIVDEVNVEDNKLYLTTHNKPLSFYDVLGSLVEREVKHETRLKNKLLKLFEQYYEHGVPYQVSFAIDNRVLILKINEYYHSSVNNFELEISKVLDIPSRYVTQLPNPLDVPITEKLVLVDCRRLFDEV